MIYVLFLIIHTMIVPQDALDKEIKALNRQMEEAFKAGDMKGVAGFYLDNAHLLSPGGKEITGRKAIDEYWTSIQDPVSWKLEVVAVTKDEEHIYENEYWKALKNKPPDWRVHGIDIENNKKLVYELGHSTLTVMYEGKESTSEVDFLLIWKYTKGGYKILLDTYAWQ